MDGEPVPKKRKKDKSKDKAPKDYKRKSKDTPTDPSAAAPEDKAQRKREKKARKAARAERKAGERAEAEKADLERAERAAVPAAPPVAQGLAVPAPVLPAKAAKKRKERPARDDAPADGAQTAPTLAQPTSRADAVAPPVAPSPTEPVPVLPAKAAKKRKARPARDDAPANGAPSAPPLARPSSRADAVAPPSAPSPTVPALSAPAKPAKKRKAHPALADAPVDSAPSAPMMLSQLPSSADAVAILHAAAACADPAAPAPAFALVVAAPPPRAQPSARAQPASSVVAVAPPPPAATARYQGERKWSEDSSCFTNGKFTQREDDALRAAVEAHLAAHPNCGYKTVQDFAGKASRGEWVVICRALPDRTLKACYEFVRRHYCANNYKGAWTDADVARLRALQAVHGNKWKLIGEELGRERTNVRDKWRDLELAHRLTGAWSDAEDAKLMQLISAACDGDASRAGFEGAIPWTQVASQLGSRTAKQCRTAWKRLASGAGAAAEMGAAEFVAALFNSGVRDPSEVRWEQVGRNAFRRFSLLAKEVEREGEPMQFRARIVALHRRLEGKAQNELGEDDDDE
jgi:hypothetical protein